MKEDVDQLAVDREQLTVQQINNSTHNRINIKNKYQSQIIEVMKKLLYVLAISLVVFTGCKKEETTPSTGDSFEILTTYLVAQDLDIPDMLASWIEKEIPADADAVPAFIAKYDILDIRDEVHFNEGHIETATYTSFANILDAAKNTSKPILVVCYTGQTASHAVIALRLSGYKDAKVLLWGMSGWRADLAGKWQANSGNDNGNAAESTGNWEALPGNITATGSFAYPEYTTTATDGAGILEERVAKMITGGFQGVPSTTVLTTPTDYFINNYWSTTDVELNGNITGTYRINPLTLEGEEIKGLDPSKTIVTYCWTGQTSSMITAYLNVIGYNAVSLKFGANSMIYTDLSGHKFVTPTTDLPVVTD